MHIGSKVQISINKPLFKSLITSVTPILSIFSRKCSLVKKDFISPKTRPTVYILILILLFDPDMSWLIVCVCDCSNGPHEWENVLVASDTQHKNV